jgi:hypothetical protein
MGTGQTGVALSGTAGSGARALDSGFEVEDGVTEREIVAGGQTTPVLAKLQ